MKPKIFLRRGRWLCSSIWVTGMGNNPAAAYHDWKMKYIYHCAEIDRLYRSLG